MSSTLLKPLTDESKEKRKIGKFKKKADGSNNGSKSPLLKTISQEILNIGEAISFPKEIKIKFAPLKVPRHRRLQTAAVAFWATLLPLCFSFFVFLCSFPQLWLLIVPYLIWVIYFDRAPDFGGRPQEWMKRLPVWKHFASYYPVSLLKEENLPADRPYIFGYHPHGIISMGAFANFATDGTGWSKAFPGIRPHLLTLRNNFNIPIYRDIIMAHGVSSVSRQACANILRKGPGSAICIVIGGAAESLRAHPRTNDLTLKRRMGFVKIAIKQGADLVPVFSFGENDIYDQLANQKGTTIYKIQTMFQKMFGFTLPIFHGRGLFNYTIGLMPYRSPIVSVVGRPILVTQNDSPSQAQLEETHQRYIDELMRIWEKYKDVYATQRTRELTIVE